MKSKKIKIAVLAIAVIAVIGLIWWFMPTKLITEGKAEKTVSIEVRNGNNGKYLLFESPEDVGNIAEKVKSASLKKEKISYGMGYTYRLTFLDGNKNEIQSFLLNSDGSVRKGIMMYKPCDSMKNVFEFTEEAFRE